MATVDLPDKFQNHCGDGNSLLQARLKELRQAHPHAVRLRYGPGQFPKSMAVRRPDYPHALLTRISTQLDPPEELREIHPAFAQALARTGLTLIGRRLSIPEEGDLDFVSRVMKAIKETLGLPSDEESPRAGTGTTFWQSLEKMIGTIEAPRDWAAEHDHYLYGGPRTNEDGGE